MQVDADEASLDADPGGVDQAAPAGEASQPGDQVVFTDGEPGASHELDQYVDSVNEA